MASIDDIRRSLSSDKVTVRKKGTTDCEELVFRNKTILAAKSANTMALIRALMEYEVKELDHNQAKDKVTPNDVPIFVKKMVKYCTVYGQVVSHKVVSLLEHILNVLYDNGLPPTYKQEHRSLLCDLLVPRITHSVPFDRQDKQMSVGLNKLFLYLKDIITDVKSVSDPTNLKLLRLMSRSLLADSCSDPGTILKFLLQWFNDLLTIATKDSNQCLPLLTACLADCCIHFMEIQGSNLCLVIFSHVDMLLQAVIKQLSTNQYREGQRASFLKFVKLLFEISQSFNWKNSFSHLSAINPLHKHIHTLCNVMCSDDSIRAAISYANTYVNTNASSASGMSSGGSFRAFNQQARDVFPTILDDSLMGLNFEVMAYAAYHQSVIAAEHRQRRSQESNKSKSVLPFEDVSLSRSEASEDEGDAVFVPSSKKPRTAMMGLTGSSNTSSSSGDGLSAFVSADPEPYLEALFIKLGGGSSGSAAGDGAPRAPVYAATQPLLTQKRPLTLMTQTNRATGEGATAHGGAMSIKDQNMINDGQLYLLVSIFGLFPKLDIIGSDYGMDSAANVVAWIKLLRRKLKGCCLSAHSLHNQQQCLLVLSALQCLSKVSHELITPSKKLVSSNAALCDEWSIVLKLLLVGDGTHSSVLRYVEDNTTAANGVQCKRHTLYERVVSLVSKILSSCLLRDSALLTFGQDVLWSPSVLNMPCLIDSPSVFKLLVNALKGTFGLKTCAGDAPVDWCSKYVRQVSDALDIENDDGSFADSGEPHLQSLVLACQDWHKNNPFMDTGSATSHQECVLLQGMQFISLWLIELASPTLQMINGRDCSGSSRVSVSCIHDFNLGLTEFVSGLMCHQDSPADCDVVVANRSVPDLGNRAGLHWLDCIPSIGDRDLLDLSISSNIVKDGISSPFQGDVTSSISILNHVKNHLLAQRSFIVGLPSAINGSSRRTGNNVGPLTSSSQKDEPFSSKAFTICNSGGVNVDLTESIIAWQVCSVMLLNIYANLVAGLKTVPLIQSRESTQSMTMDDIDAVSSVPEIFEAFLTVLYTNLRYLSSKITSVKPLQLADFCAELSYVCIKMVVAVKGQSDLVNSNGLKQCIDVLYVILRGLQTEACNKDTGTESSLNNVDFEKSDKGAIDFDDDFDVTPSRQSQMLKASQAKARAYEDLDDDFIPAGKQLVSGTRLVRANFSVEHLRSFVALSQCVLVLTSMTSRPLSLLSILDSLPLTSNAGPGGSRSSLASAGSENTIKVYTPSEVYLVLAENISLLATLLDDTELVPQTVRSLIDGCGWHIDWGMLGYCKVLRIIYNATQQRSFWKAQTEGKGDSVMKYFLALVLPNNDPVVEPFLQQIYSARVNQLECLGNCLKHCSTADIADYKQNMTTVFVEAMGDRDVRVRLTAAQKLPLLLPHFKNRDNVYNALVKASNIPLYYNGYIEQEGVMNASEEDPLLVVSTAVTLVRIGSSCGPDSALTKKSLLDLMLLCCSRRKFFADKEGYDVDLYQDLLQTMTRYLSHSLGYSNSTSENGCRLVVLDYLCWLLHQWLVGINGTDIDEDAGDKLLMLNDFPFELLMKKTQNISDGTMFAAFVASYSHVLVPLIATVSNARLRWRLLLRCSEGWYGSAVRTTDKDIGLMIKNNMCSIKALEFYLIEVGSTNKAGKALQDFVNRTLKFEVKDVVARLSDTVLALFLMISSAKASELEGSELTVSEKTLVAILRSLSEHIGGDSVTQMLINDCNLLEFLASLRCRLLETSQASVFLNVMTILKVLWSNVFQSVDDLSVSFFHGVMSTLKVAVNRFPSHFHKSVELFKTIADDMCGSHGDCKEGGLILLPHLFVELIVLLNAAHMKSTSDDRTKLGSSSAEWFPLQYFSSLEGVDNFSEPLKASVATLAQCVEVLVNFVRVSENDEILKYLLPLPAKYLSFWKTNSGHGDGSSASYRSKRTFSSTDGFGDNPTCEFLTSQRWTFLGSSAASNVIESVTLRMKEFVRLSEYLVSGEVFRPSIMWLQMVIIRNELLEFDPLAQEVVPAGWWWNEEHCSLTSSFVASLLSVCSQNGTLERANEAIVEVAQSVLGHIGPPDVFTLKHGEDFTQLEHHSSNVRSIQLSVLRRVYALLWGSCEESEEAVKCLRSLAERKFLSLVQTETQKKNSDGTSALTLDRSLSEIVSSFSVLTDCPSNVTIKADTSVRDRTAESLAHEVWTSEGKPYSQWVSGLVYHMIDCVFTDTSSTIAEGDTVHGFLLACKNVVKVRHDIAESLFPLVIFTLVSSPSMNRSFLADNISKYMLAENSAIPLRVTQMGCSILSFMFRQSVNSFVLSSASGGTGAALDGLVEPEQSVKSAASSKRNRGDQARVVQIVNSSVAEEYTAPFSMFLDIDYSVAAAAAARCHSVCSALMFAEMGEERRRHVSPSIDGGSSSSSLARTNSGGVNNISSKLNQVLMPIYQGVHDPDSLYGIDMSSSLSLQAKMYEHRGCWLEALSIYESILQSTPEPVLGGSDKAVEEARNGIASALSGLGAEATLNGLGNKNRFSSLQTWSIAEKEAETTVSLGQCVLAGLKDLNRNRAYLAQRRFQVCSQLLFNDIILKTSEESAHSVVSDLSLAQQLIEVSEVCSVIQSQEAENRLEAFNADELLSRWEKRQVGVTPVVQLGSSRDVGGSRSFQSLRFALFSHLLKCDLINPVQAIDGLKSALAIHPTLRTLNTSKEREIAAVAHAVGPLMYKYWTSIQTHIEKRRSTEGTSAARTAELSVIYADWQLQESKLLWRKGMKDVAVSNINHTIQELRQFVERQSGSSRGSVGGKSENRARNTLSEAMRLGGEWIGTKRAATGTDILTEYLNPAASFAVSVSEQIKTYETLGAFNARLFQNVSAKVASVEWQQGARVLADRVVEYEQCRALQASERAKKPSANPSAVDASAVPIDLKALDRHTHILKKEIDMDTKERAAVEASVGTYLAAAMTDYAKVLQLSPEEDLDTVVRVINLWLGNSNNAQVNDLVSDLVVDRVPTYKFVPLTYQILSRLGKSNDSSSANPNVTVSSSRTSKSPLPPGGAASGFQEVLSNLIFKLCSDHPHHTLPQLFALTHEHELEGYDGAAQFKSNISHGRCEAANDIVARLIKREEDNSAKFRSDKLVVAMKSMLLAYIDLAKTSTLTFQKSNRIKDIKYSAAQPRGKTFPEIFCVDADGRVSDKRPVSVITLNAKLNPLKDYSNIVRTQGFTSTFSITENGISRPKIITCLGSDGRQYKQLVKGGDDMRQDAVMEQVFDMVNYMLSKDTEARKRSLLIRTYKIIPTTPQTGVLQWVENTQAFGALINDKREGTHDRYYRKDWTHAACREYLKDAADFKDKLTKYNEITTHFHPSFRYFFLEKYAETTVWMAARLAYSRSMAVASMVGYILGIGDRHSQNILIDTRTGEVVHIDFGIVFEQGKGLGAPETVPFRLTRDVVDGMGITGVEGTFRKSCEEVLRVLRDNALQIMTILEVVIHDPLYKWSLSPLQARMKQNAATEFQSRLNSKVSKANDSNVSATSAVAAAAATGALQMNPPKNTSTFGKDAAERTLQRIKNKLQGCEDPTGESLSIEGLVDLLIAEARDAKNLCRLFVGWAPWL